MLINCTECGTEISNKATNCVKCGCPIVSIKPVIPKKPVPQSVERKVLKALDVFFALIYLVGIYGAFNSPGAQDGGFWLGTFILIGIIYFIQKVVKGVAATMARTFDKV